MDEFVAEQNFSNHQHSQRELLSHQIVFTRALCEGLLPFIHGAKRQTAHDASDGHSNDSTAPCYRLTVRGDVLLIESPIKRSWPAVAFFARTADTRQTSAS
jgi:hypothetical protein